MKIRTLSALAVASSLLLSYGVASADTALSVSCAGAPTATTIAWTATSSGGVSPIGLLWGNGATSSAQTLSYTPGTYSMTIQATDASSSVATSTCSATIAQAQSAPSIASFTASPTSVIAGGSAMLSWNVSNASSTSINNNVGVVTGTSVLVVPSQTTTYTLTATNPAGSSTSTVTVSVSTSTPASGSLQQQIQALLQQIRALQQQIMQLVANNIGSTTGTTTPPVIPPGQVGKGACITLNRDLSEGDSGDDVMNIQQMLAANASTTGFNVAPTGFFGPLTVRAMMRFQEDNGIASSSSGYVGPLTRGFFERHCGEGLSNENQNQNQEREQEGQMWATSTASTSASWHMNMPMIPYHPGQSGEDHGNGNQNGNGHDN